MKTAKYLDKIITSSKGDSLSPIEILAHHDEGDNFIGSHTILTEDIINANNRRTSYSIDNYSKDVWDKSFDVGIYFRTKTYDDSFMVTLASEYQERDRLKFYGQCLDENLVKIIKDEFYKSKILSYSLGDGYDRPNPDKFLSTQFLMNIDLNRI